ncbi:L-type lectin family protein [Companilactobacillus hulinensis]|uniref:hypothetical protein n=1 Tax=Companilactobacillus hulinensis TaxID=2486007 RepID=UPI000F78841A|nr:hypothetical protein [Companilactobacillus hulinensis]
MRKRRYWVFVLSILLFCISTTRVLGATPEELDELGKAVTPEGLSLKKDDMNSYFEYTPSFEDGTLNHSTIKTGLNKKYPSSDAVQLTDDVKQLSSIWSNVDKGNYINTKIPQTLSMWLYFGHATNPADGIAFVLQSDPRETKAISTYKGSVVPGETLGVWGPDIDGSQSSTAVVAAGAIQKSWALEFDTFLNRYNKAGEGSYFDYTFNSSISGNQHMAFNYPAQTSAYVKEDIDGGYGYELNHSNGRKYKKFTNYYSAYVYEDDNNDIRTNLNLTHSNSGEDSWHHLTVNYLPPTDGTNNATLTYSFNDKKIDGTPGSMLTTEKDLPYTNTTNLDLTKVLPTDKNGVIIDNRLRYGFTGSTGKYASLNMAVFETMPSLVNASSDAKVYNISQGSREIKSGDRVTYDNNLMKFSYNLNYLTGDNELRNVVAKITLPSNIAYAKEGIIGNVIYSDGKVEPVPVSEVTDNVLTHKLTRTMNDKLKGAKLEITGVAKTDKSGGYEQDTNVASAHATLMGDLYKGDVNTPQFTIAKAPRHLSIRPISLLTQSVRFGNPLHFDGAMSYDDNTAIQNKNMSILIKCNTKVRQN